MSSKHNSSSTTQSRKRVAVVGSGFGGLAAAIRLQAAGCQVTVFEKRDKPGGRAYVYHDNGFTFDAGPTVITAPHCLEELAELTGKPLSRYVDIFPVFPFYRLFWEDGVVFDYSNDDKELKRQITALAPGDWDGYQRFLKYTAEVFEEGYTKLVHVPFLNWWSMIRVAPQLMKLEAFRNVYSMVSRYIQEPHLRQAFSFHSLLVGGNPFTTSSIYTLIHHLERTWGVYFARGGTGALVQGLVKMLEDLGGSVRLSSPVDQVVTHSGVVQGVVSRFGFEPFDAVVSNADIVHTYDKLLKHEPLAQSTANHLKKQSFSMSLFLIYFGTKKTYPHLAHHNVLFGPRYKELLSDIFDKGILADDFSLYLHAPTRSDSSLAPPGHECFYVLAPVPHLGKANIDWDAVGPQYAQKLIDYMDQRYIPGLKENLVTQRIFTPKDFERELNGHMGAAFSIEPILQQSAYFRAHNRDDRIKGVYVVGAGTHPGAGLPGVINSAKATSQLVVEDFFPERKIATGNVITLNTDEPKTKSPTSAPKSPQTKPQGPNANP